MIALLELTDHVPEYSHPDSHWYLREHNARTEDSFCLVLTGLTGRKERSWTAGLKK